MLAPSNFLEPYFCEENSYCNSNINDFVMDFDICSIVKTSHLGKSALVDANYCWTFHFPCYLWAWFLKFLLLNTTSNSFFFHLLSKYLSWSQKALIIGVNLRQKVQNFYKWLINLLMICSIARTVNIFKKFLVCNKITLF